MLRLDPETGRELGETVLDDRDPGAEQSLQMRHQVLNMPVALPDILSSDGERLYMKSQVFDKEGVRQEIGPHSGNSVEQGSQQAGEGAHLFAPMGFVDDSWLHRSYWVYGRSFAGGHSGYPQAGRFAPGGRILTHDESTVYGYGRLPKYFTWTTPLDYHLFATSRDIPVPPKPEDGPTAKIAVAKSKSLNPVGHPLAVEAWVKAEHGEGVVVARGGSSHGYALILKGGRPRFLVRVEGKLSSIGAPQRIVGKWVHLAGVLTADKKLQLYVDSRLAASGDAPGLFTSDPAQPMEIGVDDGGGAGDYRSPFGFNGTIDEVRT
jgi:hypothetical protein